MKSLIKFFLMLIIVALSTVTIISCGDDEPTPPSPPSPPSSYSLIGTWTYNFSSGYCEMTFNADGTGTYLEYDHGQIESNHKFTYTYTDGMVSIYYDNGKKENSSITWLNENSFTSHFDENETWVKKNSSTNTDTYEKNKIVGTWKCVYEWVYSGIKQEITMEVREDGTLSFLTNSSSNSSTGGGTWVYNANTHEWKLSTSNSLISGEYSIINNQLICYTVFSDGSSRTVIFNK